MLYSTNISFGNCAREILSDCYSMAVFLEVIAPLNITLQRSFLNRENGWLIILRLSSTNWSQSTSPGHRERRSLWICLFSSKTSEGLAIPFLLPSGPGFRVWGLPWQKELPQVISYLQICWSSSFCSLYELSSDTAPFSLLFFCFHNKDYESGVLGWFSQFSVGLRLRPWPEFVSCEFVSWGPALGSALTVWVLNLPLSHLLCPSLCPSPTFTFSLSQNK